MTRALRSFGIPATVLVLAACGSSDVGGGDASSPTNQPPASSAPAAPPTTGASSTSPTTGSSSTSPATGTPPPTGLPTPTGPATRPTPGQGPHGPDPSIADFPLVLVRTGGIAGFRDKVVLQADGAALVVRRSSAPTRCHVDSELMDQIHAALGVVTWPAPGAARSTPPGKMSDQMTVAVNSGRHRAALDDPTLGKLAGPLGKLLGDITQPPDQRRYCNPDR